MQEPEEIDCLYYQIFSKHKVFDPITALVEFSQSRKMELLGFFFFLCFISQQKKLLQFLEYVLMACEGLCVLENNKLILSSCVIS